MPTPPIRTRFAPSPSGFLHLCNIRTALFNYLAARSGSGEMCLRIEDTDQSRSSGAHIAAIVEDLSWLGLSWAGDAPLRQSQQHAAHRQALVQLLESGAAYPCFCTPEELQTAREEQRRQNLPPRYPGTCSCLSSEDVAKRLEKYDGAGSASNLTEQIIAAAVAIRFRMPAGGITVQDLVRGDVQFSGGDIGDFIIRRADGNYAFFFANAVDDSSAGITHVLRGEDHLSNTPRQLAMLRALNKPRPQYGHLPLLTAPSGGPLSKRDGAQSVAEWRERGILPQALLNYLARVGLALPSDEIHSLAELAEMFSYQHLSSAPAAFDMQQLLHRQKQAVQNMPTAELAEWIAPALPNVANIATVAKERMEIYCTIARENAVFPEDVAAWHSIAEEDKVDYNAEALSVIQEAGVDFYTAAAEALSLAKDSDTESWRTFQKAAATATDRRGRALFMPLRAAWTGRTDGPDMPLVFQLLGKETAHRRLLQAKDI